MRPLDAILIADIGAESLSASNPLRLRLDGHTATVQVVQNALEHAGRVVPPIEGDRGPSWESAPKLNGIYLYNVLAKAGFNTALIDVYQLERARFVELASQSPRAIILSTTFTVDRLALLSLVREVKRLCPQSLVIVGGPFVMYSWRVLQRGGLSPYDQDEFAEDILFFDADGDETDLYIVSDVGEELLLEVLRRLRTGASLEDLPNTARPVDGAYQFTARSDDVIPWREVPIIWAALPEEVFASGVVPLQASTGCPYNCRFCNFIKNRHLTRVKPLDELVAEMKTVQARGARFVWFADDNFRLGKADLTEVCARFVAEGLSLKWMARVRAEVLRDVDCDLLRRAGCVEIQMGIESADEAVLAAMDKKSDPVLNEAVITRLLQAGIHCSCYFIIGFPEETGSSVETTIDFLRRLEAVDAEGLLTWSFYPFVLAPISPIFEADQRANHALMGYKHTWQHRTMDAKEARRNLVKAFLALDKSGPIYRGDNLDQLSAMTLEQARAFVTTRHALEKLAAVNQLDQAVAIVAFRRVFSS